VKRDVYRLWAYETGLILGRGRSTTFVTTFLRSYTQKVFLRFQFFHKHVLTFLASDAFVRTNRRAIAVTLDYRLRLWTTSYIRIARYLRGS